MNTYADRPGAARNLLSALRVLMDLAITEGIRSDDPTAGIKGPKLSKDGWHTWEEPEIEQYDARHPIGTRARLARLGALHRAAILRPYQDGDAACTRRPD